MVGILVIRVADETDLESMNLNVKECDAMRQVRKSLINEIARVMRKTKANARDVLIPDQRLSSEWSIRKVVHE